MWIPRNPGPCANRRGPFVWAHNRPRHWPNCETTWKPYKLVHLLGLVTLVAYAAYRANRHAHDCCDNCLDSVGAQGGI